MRFIKKYRIYRLMLKKKYLEAYIGAWYGHDLCAEEEGKLAQINYKLQKLGHFESKWNSG